MRRLFELASEYAHRQAGRGLVRSGTAVIFIKLVSAAIAFAASILYARVLGPFGYGQYAFVLAIVSLVAIPTSLGIPKYLVREGAASQSHLERLLKWANVRILIVGSLASALLAALWLLPISASLRWLFLCAAPLPLVVNLSEVRQSLIQARGKVARSMWAQQILAPGAMLAVLGTLYLVTGELQVSWLLLTAVGAAFLHFFVNTLQLRLLESPSYDAKPVDLRLTHAFPFLLLGVLHLVNNRTDILMLGAIHGAEAAGIYTVASRIAELIPFLLIVANSVLAPRIAELHQRGDDSGLQRLVSGTVRAIALPTTLFALVVIIFAVPILEVLYGAKFAPAAIALRILAVGQLVNVLAGPTGTILNMTKHARFSAISVAISSGINVLLNLLLIPYFGISGAAIATATSIVVWNLMHWYRVRRHLSLRPTAFGF